MANNSEDMHTFHGEMICLLYVPFLEVSTQAGNLVAHLLAISSGRQSEQKQQWGRHTRHSQKYASGDYRNQKMNCQTGATKRSRMPIVMTTPLSAKAFLNPPA
jgi:hypothetical protein